MTAPPISNFKKFVLHLKDVNDNYVKVSYKRILREGATLDMMHETRTHFAFTCWALAQGHVDWQEDNEAWKPYETRAEYPENLHNEARCQIFTDTIWVNDGTKNWPVSICMFHEMMSARQLFEFVLLALADEDQAALVNDVQKPVVGDVPFDDEYAEQRGNVDNALDEHFPRDENNQPSQNQPAQREDPPRKTPHHQTANGDEIPIITEWSSKNVEQYVEQYAGTKKGVGIRISKLVRVKKARQDGEGFWEAVEVYPEYRGMPGQYPASQLKTYIDDREHNYDWKKLRSHPVIGKLLHAPKTTCTAPGIMICKINVVEKEDGTSDVYWNVAKVELDRAPEEWEQGGPPPHQHENGDKEEDDKPFGDDRDSPDWTDVPF